MPIFINLTTYCLVDACQIFSVFNKVKDGSGPRAVWECLWCALIRCHHRGFAKGSKVERVNDATLVGLTSDQLAKGCPNLCNETQLGFLDFLSLLSCRHALLNIYDGCNLRSQIFGKVGQCVSTHNILQDVVLGQCRLRCHRFQWGIGLLCVPVSRGGLQR